jgi:hypothetical protein
MMAVPSYSERADFATFRRCFNILPAWLLLPVSGSGVCASQSGRQPSTN